MISPYSYRAIMNLFSQVFPGSLDGVHNFWKKPTNISIYQKTEKEKKRIELKDEK